jgi:release factor glutamine methyltransferase
MAVAGEQWTVLKLIDWTREYFARSGLEEPRLAAEILLADVLGCERVRLYARYDEPVAAEPRGAFRELVRRAAAGEPIAYLTGRKEFYSLSFKVTPDVLIPRPETELLVDAALEVARAADGPVRLWDLCTGSGCVPVAAARYAPNLTALASDISEAALAVAAANVAAHQLDDRIRLERADLFDAAAEATGQEGFHVITANPPYVSEGDYEDLSPQVRREPAVALRAGADGLEVIRAIAAGAAGRLAPGGTLAVEIGMGQADAVHDLLTEAGGYEDIRFRKDPAGIERTAVARRAT